MSFLDSVRFASTTYEDLPYGVSSSQVLDVYIPLAPVGRAVVCVHGGGWANDSRREAGPLHLAQILSLLHSGLTVVNADYRLSGAATFPAAVQDVKAAVRWTRRNAAGLGVESVRIGVWGASAGGHLAMMAAVSSGTSALAMLAQRAETSTIVHLDAHPEDPVSSGVQACAATCAPYDLAHWDADVLRAGFPLHDGTGFNSPGSVLSAFIGRNAGGTGDEYGTLLVASPLPYVGPDSPPLLVVAGTADQTVPQGQALTMHATAWLRGADVAARYVAGAGHSDGQLCEPAEVDAVSAWLAGRLA